LAKGRCEKNDLSLFPVIPAKAGIQCFQNFANFLDPGFHRGDDLNSIFSHLQGGVQGDFEKIPPTSPKGGFIGGVRKVESGEKRTLFPALFWD
jgi:hypothetical protein